MHLDEATRTREYAAFKEMLATDPAHAYPPFERKGVAGMVFKTAGAEPRGHHLIGSRSYLSTRVEEAS